jgi:tRNA G18 (ribose-2'-O)-methylase SpoU
MALVELQDARDQRLAPYLGMKDAELRYREAATLGGALGGLFIAEGELVVRRLVDSPYRLQSLLVTPTRLRTIEDLIARLDPEIPVFVAPQTLMNQISGFNMHRGVLAVGARGVARSLETALEQAEVAVLLEDLINHDNLGSVFRNVAALAGCDRALVVLSPRCSDPLYRKSLRVSVGWALQVPFVRADSWDQALAGTRRAGFRSIALTPHPSATPIAELTPAPGRRVALIVGTEGAGLRASTATEADLRVRIPITSQVDSLNVATALAIALHRIVGG